MSMKTLRVLVLALAAWGCATNPATGKRQIMLMSESEEIQLGKQNDAEVRKQMGVYQDPELQRYVAGIGARLAQTAHRPTLPWTFTVVDEPAVNAFALPGGFIYVTRGILPYLRNEAELAAVMAHEVGHVDARHSAQQYSQQTLAGGGLALLGIFVPETRPAQGLASAGLGALFLKFSREDELEADQLGVRYASLSGWEPKAMPGLLGTLARLDEATGSSRGVPNWALTHPPAADRVVKVQEAVAAAPGTGHTTDEAQFERQIDGIVFGDSREKGIVRGNEFLHPILRFAVRFPDGWEIVNTDEQVTAQQSETSNVAMLLQATSASGPVDQIAPAQMAQAGWTPISGDHTTINGLDAYVGTYQGAINNVRAVIRAAHVRAGQQVYVIAGVAPASQFDAASRTFSQSIQTFRTLSQQEADRIQPNRVDFYTVRNGDTWDAIARRGGEGAVKPSTLAIMNGSDPGTPPRPGARVRVVVGG
jgi:predicted Zn-dependent protease